MIQIKSTFFMAAFALMCCIGFAAHNSVLAAETKAAAAPPAVHDTQTQTAAEEATEEASAEKTADKKKSKCDCDCEECKKSAEEDKS